MQQTYGSCIELTDEGIPISIFCRGHLGLGLDDRVDAADCILSAGKKKGDFREALSPLLAASVETSNKTLFLTSRLVEVPASATPPFTVDGDKDMVVVGVC